MDIHNYKKRYERTLERIKDSNEITDDNKEIVLNFKDYLLSEGIGFAKIERYLGDILKFSKMLSKPFPDVTEQDLRKIIGELNQTNLSEETKKTFKIMLRKFYRFIRGIIKNGQYPPEVEWMSIAIPNNHKKLPEELLTEEEILISSIEFNRDYTNLRLDGLNSLTVESFIAQYKLYQKSRAVREEYKTKLPIPTTVLFELLNSGHNYASLSLKTHYLTEEVVEIKKLLSKILGQLRR